MSIYDMPAEGAEVTVMCGGNLGGENESCAAIASIPGTGEAFILRDTKPEGAGRELRFTASEMDALALGWTARRGLTA
ncbi:DUF397 domain-containing protein [Peterkaempfera bronchialis]|uniref:DUF397 domain-containing protein n=1 Tax=Peterkaempfera bronchialis TaxID=2126346 RepID=A0A345SXM6_9ACTN|nr:DUF397 domain-containing protein [Peterkaempfera bronchialis]AXI78481.1 DUF397 domain-containing protein [Peterkaempfera bronchialis]